MKKILVSLFVVLSLALSANAAYINDTEGVLTAEETALLEQMAENIAEVYDVGAYLLTERDTPDDNISAVAEKYLTEIELSDTNDLQILLYLSTYERVYYVIGDDILTDEAFANIENAFLPYLREDDWVGACTGYVEAVENLFANAPENWKDYLTMTPDDSGYDYGYDSPYDSNYPYDDDFDPNDLYHTVYEPEKTRGNIADIVIVAFGILILPLIIAFIMTGIKLGQMNTASGKTDADSFVKYGSMNLTDSRDIFLYSNIVRTKKPEPEHHNRPGSSHGGMRHGGGSFRPSGGGHAGRGGRF